MGPLVLSEAFGIKREFDTTSSRMQYEIDTTFIQSANTPKEFKDLTRSAVDIVVDDAIKNNSLEKMVVTIKGESKDSFLWGFTNLRDDLYTRKDKVPLSLARKATSVSALGAGIPAYMWACPKGVSAGHFIDNLSPYLAPIAGLVEAGIPLGSAFLAGGAVAYLVCSATLEAFHFADPFGKRIYAYEKLKKSIKE